MNNYSIKRLLMLSGLLMVSAVLAYAQSGAVSGRITDQQLVPLEGASVSIQELGLTASTSGTGEFSFADVPNGTYTLVATFIGYEAATQTVAVSGQPVRVSITMVTSAESLEEVVVIGYGTQRKGELTGSMTTVTTKDFQKGAITTPEQLISGKAAGVQITPNGGRPGAGSTIRIRAGASLNASNDPLIVIDGVPLSGGGIDGSPNALGLINPNDIESFTILKDANATAIYGSRASNGVILITTKKGVSGRPRVSFSSQNSVATLGRRLDVLSADQLRSYVEANGSEAQVAQLGTEDVDWQDVVYRNAFATDNNLSVSGTSGFLPYRVSVGYLRQDGILQRDEMDRTSAAISLSPKFFDNHLKVDLNLKGSMQNSMYANQGAIFNALQFDPTHPIHEENAFGNFFEWMQGDIPHPLAPRNPLGLIELRDDDARVNRSFGNVQLDYSFHFLPELHANVNLGYDVSRGKGDVFVPAHAAQNFSTQGTQTRYLTDISNKVAEFYLNYGKTFEGNVRSNLDVTAGYGYYDYKTTRNNYPTLRADGSVLSTPNFPFDIPQNRLISYYGRAIYTLADKYILSGTLRTDGSSRFSPENRWGVFPSAGFTWRLKNEAFFADAANLSSLNLRLSYGKTGQQDGIANYSYLANYYLSTGESQYQLGNNFYQSYSPIAYDQDIRWESTATYNAGLDYGFLNNRISGTVDVYYKKTEDLLSVIPIPVGTNFSNLLLTNVGNMENTGVEFNINTIPIQQDDLTWEVDFNFTYNHNKVTNLTAVDDPNYFTEVGYIEGGTGQNVQVHTVGYSPFTYRLYKQVYHEDGTPLEGVYEDLDGNGLINDLDRNLYKSPLPQYILGFSTGVAYKRWNINTVLRANIGNYVYDNITSNMAVRNNVINPAGIINNAPVDLLHSNFQTNRAMSDYYLHNASFLRMDNLSLSYNVGRLFTNSSANLLISANVQNVFTVSKYDGIDPEVQSGIDNRVYPRPRTFVLGLNLGF
ncbi:SusC/RagA family TonB-linked outer membrane protein [Parapedobacter sp. 2B3]|uniref:SusC/RagA family TonB-linked outer membrane protein n=1 Tax=Parapedobacter sp. 2B3 TaxID=3342381 RepID=UPI0035B5E0E2